MGRPPRAYLYALNADSYLYGINPITAASTMIGSTRIWLRNATTFGVSVGAPVLYVAVDNALYSINVKSAGPR